MTGEMLTVALDPADETESRLHQTVLAGLPGRFSVVADSAHVVLISGNFHGWHERARSAIRTGARAIMLAGCQSLTARAVADLGQHATDAGVIAAAAAPFASDPGWTAALPLMAADLQASAVLDSVATAPVPPGGSPSAALRAALRAALAGQLAMVRQLLPGLDGLVTAHASDLGYVLASGTPGIAITLSGTVSGTGQHRVDLDLVGSDRRWHASLRADTLAFPSRITVSDTDGELTRPPVYESGHRAAWAALHEAVRAQTAPGYPAGYPVGDLARDLASAEAALGPAASAIIP